MKAAMQLLVALFVTVMASCNGDAPLLTCRDPCAYPDEYRDSFCKCQKRKKPGTPGPVTPEEPPQPGPYMDFEWKEANGCSINRKVWLLNPSTNKLVVTVSEKVQGSTNRRYTDHTIGPKKVTRAQGIYLGLEEEPSADGGLCFDKDFMINKWKGSEYASVEAFALASLAARSTDMRERQETMIAMMQRIEVANAGSVTGINDGPKITYHKDAAITQTYSTATPIDCVKACDSNDPLKCPIKGFPPDQDKLIRVRDRIREPTDKSIYDPADIYSIFGLDKKACTRNDVYVSNSKFTNAGQYCAFPAHLRETDTEPSFAIHFPWTVRGERIAQSPESGGMVFGAGFGMPSLFFAANDLNSDFGGSLLDVMATDKGIYYQTTGGCIFLGDKP